MNIKNIINYQTVSVLCHHIPSPFLILYNDLNIIERDNGILHLYLSNGCGFVFSCAEIAFFLTICFC